MAGTLVGLLKRQQEVIKYRLDITEIQSNLGYPNVDYPKLLGYSKTTDSPVFFSLLSIAIKLPII